ncbi:hypothetical protein CYLTODRAFT_366451 [Cylindrobasidium torrendii FP15055 ss-10]|uniref:DNA topoisomerase I n=1 Tax=Cylindrobasidium torrendii FP15055 ss-10 TaxID=1314674 RepID=A0A0D7BTY3_9AGAR|nr:hypothetical protein CYLTODRAFT_366451 [Cylindrobasidium torrendii FP15055 ss-10]
MPGAHEATTVPASKAVNGNGKAKKSKPTVKAEADDDDDIPLAAATKPKRVAKKAKIEPESDEEVPKPKRKAAPRKSKVKEESDADHDSEEDGGPKKRKRSTKRAKKEESEDEVPDVPKKKRVKKEEDPEKEKIRLRKEKEKEERERKKAEKIKKEEEEAAAVFRWWEQDKKDNSQKWTTLEHQGVYFPPPYEPLPPNVKMIYDGKTVDLPPDSEEVMGFYAALLETEHAQDETFNSNFFADWLKVLGTHPPRNSIKIKAFDKCDFRPVFQYFEEEKAKKKALTTAEKKALKEERDKIEAPYAFCIIDGRKEKVGNFRIEPPGLFRGRGEHPRKGALKQRVRPEDITLNIGKDSAIPKPNMPGKWKAIQHDNTVTWLANWIENVNQSHKYVFLAAGSSLKGQSDMAKFEKARELKDYVDQIREDYTVELKSKVMAERQRATAMYFIDKLALRAGNEKGEDEADTVGCCSLRCEHVTLEPPNVIIFDFLGKDSIRYYNNPAVEGQVFKNVKIFKENKDEGDPVFDRVTTASLNKHLNNQMKGLTAKVFRTYNASITFQTLLDEQQEKLKNATFPEKMAIYNAANRQVAILCNHQRAAPKTHDQSMEKMRFKIKGLRYDRMKLRHQLVALDSKQYKKRFDKEDEEDEDSDIDDDWIEDYETQLEKVELEKAMKKFAKDNEKRAADGQEALPQEDLDTKLEGIKTHFAELAKERGTGKAKGRGDAEKVMTALQKLEEKIALQKSNMSEKDKGKEVALSTSKINYLDPRITVAWCKANDVDVRKMFSKTLMTKFPWAMEVEDDWKF